MEPVRRIYAKPAGPQIREILFYLCCWRSLGLSKQVKKRGVNIHGSEGLEEQTK
jgi:hypothetical protein